MALVANNGGFTSILDKNPKKRIKQTFKNK